MLAFTVAGAVAGFAAPQAAHADSSLELVAGSPLDFGSLVVLGSGTKQIGADGAVSANGLVTVRGTREGPAQFTLTYRPERRTRTAIIRLFIGSVPQLSAGGTTGTVTDLVTDLPGLRAFLPGRSQIYTMPPCPPPSCTVTFRVGGRLALSGGATGASFTFPLPLSAQLVAEL